MAFPAGPYTDGQTHVEGGVTYTYSTANSVWDAASSAGGTTVTSTFLGDMSITGGGDFTADRTFELVNDYDNPPPGYFYGTTSTGVKGWRSGRANPPWQTAKIVGPVNIVSMSGNVWTDTGGDSGGVYVFQTSGVRVPLVFSRLNRVKFIIKTTLPNTSIFLGELTGGAFAGGATDANGVYVGHYLFKSTFNVTFVLRTSGGATVSVDYAYLEIQAID